MAQALGVRLLDERGEPIGRGGGALIGLTRIDVTAIDATVATARFVVATDVRNPLVGANGAAAVYGPQKGATPEQVVLLDRALGHLAAVIERDLGIDLREAAGAGAAGGLGAGLVAFLGARLRPGADVVMEAVGFDGRLAEADLAITGEGRLDASSFHGKVVGEVIARARAGRVPVAVLCGSAEERPNGVAVHELVGGTRAADDREPAASLEALARDVAAAR
jgi:glycerate kinase